MKLALGTVLTRKSTRTNYIVKEWSEDSANCLLEQINKTDVRQKVMNRISIEKDIVAGKLIIK